MKKHIPNFITLLNLASGSIALYMILNEHFIWVLILFIAAVIFDFLDGFVARMLKISSEVGKQLDSLADLVSFGLVPAAMIFMILESLVLPLPGNQFNDLGSLHKLMLISVATVPMFSALRLAKFNIQHDGSVFLGLPTPAFALFWTGIYYDISINNSIFGQSVNVWLLWGLMVLMSFFMVIPLPMLTLKFKNFKVLPNFSRYLLLSISVLILSLTGIPGLTLVILTYILLSLLRILLT